MATEVKETGLERHRRLHREAKALGITGRHTTEELEELIEQKPAVKGKITPDEAKAIEEKLRYEDEIREKFRLERQARIDRAAIIVEAEKARVKIDLPELPTELELARARAQLGIKKKELKPSPETVAIENSKKGYYIFTNREQDDAAHTVNPGGKYTIHLIPDQIHVLSAAHIKLFKKFAVVPVYNRVPVPGPPVEGRMGEECRRTGSKQRFAFEYLGEAPQDARFGLVTDTKILDKLAKEEEI